jgi:hypothetical protein
MVLEGFGNSSNYQGDNMEAFLQRWYMIVFFYHDEENKKRFFYLKADR